MSVPRGTRQQVIVMRTRNVPRGTWLHTTLGQEMNVPRGTSHPKRQKNPFVPRGTSRIYHAG